MPPRHLARARRALIALSIAALLGASCAGAGGVLPKEYEYEEEIYLALDGTATVNVNASVASLVALRGFDLPLDPRARIDREKVRALFAGPGAEAVVSLSRRDGRRFVHASVDVDDIRTLQRLAPFAWSSYRLDRRDETVEYRQQVGKPAGRPVGDVGWNGGELVMFKLHVPSRIESHNTPTREIERGNILQWEQPLAERLQGTPIEIEVQMQGQSILSSTLVLFAFAIGAAALVFVVVIWWVVRRGRDSAVVESRP